MLHTDRSSEESTSFAETPVMLTMRSESVLCAEEFARSLRGGAGGAILSGNTISKRAQVVKAARWLTLGIVANRLT